MAPDASQSPPSLPSQSPPPTLNKTITTTPPPTPSSTKTSTPEQASAPVSPAPKKQIMPESPVSIPSAVTKNEQDDTTMEEDTAPVPPSTDTNNNTDTDTSSSNITLTNVKVRIQKRPTTDGGADEYEAFTLGELNLPKEPTLNDVRTALTGCELGDPVRDIFFPAWTKSLYILSTPNGTAETVETDEQLGEIVERELEKPGSVTLLLQECRNARYSRRKRTNQGGAHMRSGTMNAYWNPAHMAIQYAQAQYHRADSSVYFDRALPGAPTYFHHHLYGAPGAYPPEVALFHPHYMMPFMYAPQQH